MTIELEESELELLRNALKSHVEIVIADGHLKKVALLAGMPDGISESIKKTVTAEVEKEIEQKERERKNKVFHVNRKIEEVLSRASEFRT